MKLTSEQTSILDYLIFLKVHEYRKEAVVTINHTNFKEYLFNFKWREEDKIDTCDLVDDVMKIGSADIFEYLSYKAIKEGSKMSIDGFKDLL